MTQPAKVQEPSMEEILASIRRIIADDEAKPAAAEKPASPAAARPEASGPGRRRDEGYSALGDCARRGEAGRSQARAAAAASAGAGASRQQQSGRHRRDARQPRCGNARGRDQAGTARRRCVRTHRRDGIAGSGAGAHSFNKIEPQDDIEFSEARVRQGRGSRPMSRRRSKAPAAGTADPVALDRLRGRVRLQFAGQYRAEQQRADAGRPGQGNAAADAEILARRQSAGTGGADRQGRNRAGFARALAGSRGRYMPGLPGRRRTAPNPPSRRRDHGSSAAPDRLVRLTCGAVAAF